MTAASPQGNFRQSELDKFDELAQRWWDPQGPQKALHALNPARLGYVAQASITDAGSGTCSSISMQVIASNAAGISLASASTEDSR